MLADLLLIKFGLLLYLVVFVLRAMTTQLFNQYFFASWSENIRLRIIQWVNLNPEDEWIQGARDSYQEREIGEGGEEEPIFDDEEELPETLQGMFNSVWAENSSNLFVVVRCILTLIYLRYMLTHGRFGELLLGFLSGLLYHGYHLGRHLFTHMYNWYFNQPTEIDLQEVISTQSKFTPVFLVLWSVGNAFALSFLKASVYTRILGEWIFDISFMFLVVAQMVSYFGIQASIQLILRSKKSPLLILLVLSYLALMIVV